MNELPDVVNTDTIMALEPVRTHNGQRLTPKEDAFISLYLEFGDATKAAEEAGYVIREHYKNKVAQYRKKGQSLLSKDYIRDEIAYRTKEMNSSKIANAEEILMYLTSVMRGEEKDQFNLDVSISDRTAAAKELNRRLKEIEDSSRIGSNTREVHLVLERG